jgi:spermidine synthase
MSGTRWADRRIFIALSLMGFITVLAQIVFLRRGIANFSGSELGLGVGLFSWLLWVGVGGLSSHRLFRSIGNPERFLYISLLALAILFPLTLIALDLIRSILGIQVGRLVDIRFIAGAYFFILAPFCLVDGADFTFGAAAAGKGRAGLALAAESLGAAAGGVFFFTAGTRLFQGLELAWFALLLTAVIVLWTGWKDPMVRYLSMLLGMAALVLLAGGGRVVSEAVLDARWDDFSIVMSKDSPLGNLNWAVRPGEDILFYDGIPILAYPDIRSAEEAVQPGLISHPDPRKVLLVASRATGVLDQVLKHPVQSVDLVLLDKSIPAMEAHFIKETEQALNDPRVTTVTGDVRRFLKAVKPGTYDLIIMNLPDPDTLQFNRLYTEEFFSRVKTALRPEGLFSFSTGEPANYIMPGQARYLASLDASLDPWFSHRIYYPLSRYVIVAGDRDPGVLTGEMADRVALEREVNLKYIQSGYLDYDLSRDRMAAIPDALIQIGEISGNSDLMPSAVLHRINLWAERVGRASFLSIANRDSFGWIVMIGCFISLTLMAFASACTGGTGVMGSTLLFMGGFGGISAEVVLLYLYQVNYGYLYSHIALLLSVFMAGTAAGAMIPERFRKGVSSPVMYWTAYFLLLVVMIRGGLSGVFPEIAGLILFLLLMTLAGILTGMSFAAGSSLLELKRGQPAGGAAYGLDLTGAALGAIISGLVLPLVLGLVAPLVFCLLLSAFMALGLMLRPKGRKG